MASPDPPAEPANPNPDDGTVPEVPADDANDADDRRGERREPVVVALLVASALPFLMPDGFSPGPHWVLPALVLVLLTAMLVSDPGRIDRRSAGVHALRIALVVVLAVGAAWSTAWLAADILRSGEGTGDPGDLLLAGALVLAYMVIAFAFVYWELDGGGPGRRAHETVAYPDLAFPQHLNPGIAPPGWRPVFVDYLYLSTTNAMAFSPTDVMPLTHWAKLTMALQSLASLTVLGLVIARAVNVLN